MARKGLRALLGPFAVAIGELQSAPKHGGRQPPLLRCYYPCAAEQGTSPTWIRCQRWLPSVSHAYGFIINVVRPSTVVHQALAWILACIVYVLLWPASALPVFVSRKLVPREEQDAEKEKMPVVIFSHGLWACRTSYTALCCDLASHGYIVVAPEHLDGSANMACYLDNQGNKHWVEHKFADAKFKNFLDMNARAEQLKQRREEICLALDAVEALNRGDLPQSSNLVTGKLALNVDMFRGRIDVGRMVLAGHSFGGASSIVTSGYENRRVVCCLGLDVWWEPVEKTDYEKACGNIPVLLLNTEKFDWEALRTGRLMFLNARAEAAKREPCVTKLATIKGTAHQDQSDLPLLLPKKLALAGNLEPLLAKDMNSRACLRFLQEHIPRSEKRYPTPVESVKADDEYLVFSDI